LLPVKAPGFGDRRKAMLQDIAGSDRWSGRIFGKISAIKLENVHTCRLLGPRPRNVMIDKGKHHHRPTAARQRRADIEARVQQIKAQRIEEGNHLGLRTVRKFAGAASWPKLAGRQRRGESAFGGRDRKSR